MRKYPLDQYARLVGNNHISWLRGEIVFFELGEEGLVIDLEDLRSVGFIPSTGGEDAVDVEAFHVVH